MICSHHRTVLGVALVLLVAVVLAGCGGGAPLMHAAHALDAQEVTVGGGFSGTVALRSSGGLAEKLSPTAGADDADQNLEQGAFAPGLAPWVSGRLGFDGDFDGGLTYTGRSIRIDGRRAFDFGDTALSLGLGVSGLLPKRHDDLGLRVGGFGGDIPLLFGWRSRADIYAAWVGARGGVEVLRGKRDIEPDPLGPPDQALSEDLSGWHAHAGGLFGFRVGFRYIFAVMELGMAMHWAEGDIGGRSSTIGQLSLTPSGALVGRF